MKLVFLVNSLGGGGAEKSILTLVTQLMRNGHEVTLICLNEVNSKQQYEFRGLPVEMQRLHGSFVIQLIRLACLLRGENVDVLHATLFRSLIVSRLLSVFLPKIVFVDSLVSTPYSPARLRDPRLSRLKMRVVQGVDALTARLGNRHFHAISRFVVDHYHTFYPIRPGNHSVIYRGRAANPGVPPRPATLAELRLAPGDFVFVHVGRHEYPKAHVTLIHAFSNLHVTDGRPVKLLLLGKEGEQTSAIRLAQAASPLSDSIILAGFRLDVESILMRANAFVFPSRYEGLGGALLEAMAAGLPVICTDIPVFREVIPDPEGAVFVPADDVPALTRAMQQVYDDDSLRQRLARYSHTRFLEAFEESAIFNQMEALYRQLTEAR